MVRILHDKSFSDDPTRLYRAARFAGRFGWSIERNTARLMQDAAREEYPLVLSRERVRQELGQVFRLAGKTEASVVIRGIHVVSHFCVHKKSPRRGLLILAVE